MTPQASHLFGLIGDPVSHSLSPFIMNRAFDALSLDAIYVAFGVKPERLGPSLAGLTAMGVAGLNVTYPYKDEILYHVDAISAEVEVINAVNTMVFYDDETQGFNTDAAGTAIALEQFAGISLDGIHALIYGMGGSARAAAYGLLERGAERVVFVTRSPEKGDMVIERFAYAFPRQSMAVVSLDASSADIRRDAFRHSEIIINATPVGMGGHTGTSLIQDVSWIRHEQLFFDFVYHPKQTAFLEAARKAGARTLGGIALLVSQAAESFRLWTDQRFDVKEMAEAVEEFSKTEHSPGRRVN
ncbi:MAG TPA: shikimate dehydrogenase [Candidatus Krumholzibacteria bacterium]|nr:shikimate dehydrogenase [Candidatus Krumholzibacteria bacterium]